MRRFQQSLFPVGEAADWIDREFPEEKNSWRRFKRVVYALYLRRLQQQLAGEYAGFVWLLLEPLLMIILFTAMHTVIRGRTSSSYDIVLFMGSGFVPFFLFRTILNTSLRVFKQNRSIYHYPQIKPIDVFLANAFFEISRYTIVALILLLMGWMIGIEVLPKDFDSFMIAVLWFTLFAMSWGLLLGVLSLFYELVAKIVSYLSLPLLFLSGVFYSLSSIPPQPREWLLYNPVAHFMEWLHGSYVVGVDTRYVDLLYILEWTIVPLFLALWLYRKSEGRFIVQ